MGGPAMCAGTHGCSAPCLRGKPPAWVAGGRRPPGPAHLIQGNRTLRPTSPHHLPCPHLRLLQDEEYKAAGATIGSTSDAFGQDIVLKIRPPSEWLAASAGWRCRGASRVCAWLWLRSRCRASTLGECLAQLQAATLLHVGMRWRIWAGTESGWEEESRPIVPCGWNRMACWSCHGCTARLIPSNVTTCNMVARGAAAPYHAAAACTSAATRPSGRHPAPESPMLPAPPDSTAALAHPCSCTHLRCTLQAWPARLGCSRRAAASSPSSTPHRWALASPMQRAEWQRKLHNSWARG